MVLNKVWLDLTWLVDILLYNSPWCPSHSALLVIPGCLTIFGDQLVVLYYLLSSLFTSPSPTVVSVINTCCSHVTCLRSGKWATNPPSLTCCTLLRAIQFSLISKQYDGDLTFNQSSRQAAWSVILSYLKRNTRVINLYFKDKLNDNDMV